MGPVRPPSEAPEAPAGEEQQIYLRYDFAALKGQVAEYRIQTILRQTKRIDVNAEGEGRKHGEGSAVSTTRQTYTCRFDQDSRGKARVFLTSTRVEAEIEENGQRTRTYDSQHDPQAPKGLEAFTERLGKTAILDVDRRGEVKKVSGVKPSAREGYRSNFHHFPSRGLVIGKGWEDKTKQPIPPFGNLHYFTTFRLKGIARTPEGLERYTVGAKILVTYEGISPTESSRLEITEQEGEGHLIVDERGLLIEEKLTSRVAYSIKSVAGREHHSVQSETVRWLAGLRPAEGNEAGGDGEDSGEDKKDQ